MQRHSESALQVAHMLNDHPAVSAVHYPGLPGFGQSQVAKAQMALPGGMIAFELESGLDGGKRMMNRLKLVLCAVSLGDAETLIQHPASMTHSTYTAEEQLAHGITPGLLRLSVGLEHPGDIIEDLRAALDPELALRGAACGAAPSARALDPVG